jgi:hypothetical protein
MMDDLKRGSDPYCAKTRIKNPEVLVHDGKLQNVLVRLNGAPATSAPTQTAHIEQHDCMYSPRLQGVVSGQVLVIKNADGIMHNVHAYVGPKTVFNIPQILGMPNIERKLTDSGTLLKLKCDVHPWMAGYVWVQNNRYFAVTGTDGSFAIDGVPAGKYEIEAWHERFGAKKTEVLITPNATTEVKLAFTGS